MPHAKFLLNNTLPVQRLVHVGGSNKERFKRSESHCIGKPSSLSVNLSNFLTRRIISVEKLVVDASAKRNTNNYEDTCSFADYR